MILKFEGEFPTLNEYIDVERGNKYDAAKMKEDWTYRVAYQVENKYNIITEPFIFKCVWYTKDLRKDPDNVAFAKKFILDGLVVAKLIPGDGRKVVKGFIDEFEIDKTNPRVEVSFNAIN